MAVVNCTISNWIEVWKNKYWKIRVKFIWGRACGWTNENEHKVWWSLCYILMSTREHPSWKKLNNQEKNDLDTWYKPPLSLVTSVLTQWVHEQNTPGGREWKAVYELYLPRLIQLLPLANSKLTDKTRSHHPVGSNWPWLSGRDRTTVELRGPGK